MESQPGNLATNTVQCAVETDMDKVTGILILEHFLYVTYRVPEKVKKPNLGKRIC